MKRKVAVRERFWRVLEEGTGFPVELVDLTIEYLPIWAQMYLRHLAVSIPRVELLMRDGEAGVSIRKTLSFENHRYGIFQGPSIRDIEWREEVMPVIRLHIQRPSQVQLYLEQLCLERTIRDAGPVHIVDADTNECLVDGIYIRITAHHLHPNHFMPKPTPIARLLIIFKFRENMVWSANGNPQCGECAFMNDSWTELENSVSSYSGVGPHNHQRT
jgi:hypothetical protein